MREKARYEAPQIRDLEELGLEGQSPLGVNNTCSPGGTGNNNDCQVSGSGEGEGCFGGSGGNVGC